MAGAARARRAQGGVDAGDHPPITPVAPATEEELGGGDAWRLYDFVARWFLGSVSPDCIVRKTKAVLTAGGEAFVATGTVVLRPGFAAVMPWRAPPNEPLPALEEGEALPLQSVELVTVSGPRRWWSHEGKRAGSWAGWRAAMRRGPMQPTRSLKTTKKRAPAEKINTQGKTSPPDHLTEAELIERMERHGIGTDASIPTHINNIIGEALGRGVWWGGGV